MFVDTKKLLVFINIFFYNNYILLPRKNRGVENMVRRKGRTNKTWPASKKWLLNLQKGLFLLTEEQKFQEWAIGIVINRFIKYNNNGHLAYPLNYKSSIQYSTELSYN